MTVTEFEMLVFSIYVCIVLGYYWWKTGENEKYEVFEEDN